MMASSIKTRSEVDPIYKWHIEDIYASIAEWEAGCERLSELLTAFEKYQNHAAQQPAAAIIDMFAIRALAERLSNYARMQVDTDGGNDAMRACYERIGALIVNTQSATAFLKPELLSLSDEALMTLAAQADMADYVTYIKAIIREKPHTLSTQEERILALAGGVAASPFDIYRALTDVNLVFPEVTDETGALVQANYPVYITLLQSQNREVRKSVYTAHMSAYAAFGTTLSQVYAASVKSDLFQATARGFASCREAALFENEIPLSVYDSLISAIHTTLPTLSDYLALKKEALALDALHMYDLYCPLLPDVDMHLPYEDAYALVKKALSPMGADYVAILEKAYTEGWIDVFSSKGKTDGAYSNAVYGVHPYILLNHEDTMNGTLTIAHELGHAVHSYYANAAQPFPKADYCTFVAEVASTLNEILTLKHLMAETEDPRLKASLCCHLLEHFRSTVFRQTMFSEFEHKAHALAEAGEPLTQESLSQVYYDLVQTYYGAACELDEMVKDEWLRIPHFYFSFYVYQYATGFCASVFLADRILKEGDAAVRDVRAFLSAGASLPPIEALKLAGVDMSTPEPVIAAMSVFRETIEELKALMKQAGGLQL